MLGETIAALASLGGVVLVWTGLSMAICRASHAMGGGARPSRLEVVEEDEPEVVGSVRG